MAEDFQGINGADAGGAVHIAPGEANVVADVRAGFRPGDGELGDVAEFLEGVDRVNRAAAIDVALNQSSSRGTRGSGGRG